MKFSPGEQHYLAADELGPGLVEVQSLQDDEEAFVVDVELGALVGVDRVFDRERVRGEVQCEVVELVVRGLVQPQPGKAAGQAPGLADRLRDADGLPVTLGV
jgi:hypothetical protein